jgi:cell division septum initiation protein DivIVA
VLAASAAALACTIAAIAAAALGILARMLDANSRRTIESTREQAERMIEATRQHADRLIEATREHADCMERMTKAHAQALRAQILDLNWLLTAKFRGEALAQMDARHDPNGFNPSDTGPFPTVRNGG